MKVHKNPEYSPMYDLDQTSEFKENADLETFGTMDFRKVLIMFAFFASLVAIVYGGIKMDWDMEETAAIFFRPGRGGRCDCRLRPVQNLQGFPDRM